MEEKSAKIATICECIDHCFAFEIFCDDFVRHADPEDIMWGLDRAIQLVSDATRLQSFLALRKVDEFLRAAKKQKDDLIASDLGIDAKSVLDDVGDTFLTSDEREMINKGVAHLTDKLSPDPDSEVDLQAITNRSMPILINLTVALRKADTSKEAVSWLDGTDALIARGAAPPKSTSQTAEGKPA